MRVPLSLDDDLPTSEGIWVECNGIDATIPRCLCNLHFTAVAAELSPKHLANEVLEVLPIHGREVNAVIELVCNGVALYEPGVFHVQDCNGSYRCQIYKPAAGNSLEALEASFGIDTGQVQTAKLVPPSLEGEDATVRLGPSREVDAADLTIEYNAENMWHCVG